MCACACVCVGTVSPLEILTVAGPKEAHVLSSDLVPGETLHIINCRLHNFSSCSCVFIYLFFVCRLPFVQDIEYGNTTHLGDCDGELFQFVIVFITQDWMVYSKQSVVDYSYHLMDLIICI